MKMSSLFAVMGQASPEQGDATLRDELARCQRALTELESNETHFRALVETSGDLVWTVDEKGCFTYVNGSAVETILGYRAEDVIGAPFTRFASGAAAQ